MTGADPSLLSLLAGASGVIVGNGVLLLAFGLVYALLTWLDRWKGRG